GAFGVAQRQIPARMEGEGELGRCLPPESRVRARPVVIRPPTPKGNASLGQRGEQHLIQKLIPQAAVEAFDEGVLHRLAWRDVVPCDMALIGPCQDGVACEFAAIVADNHLRLAALDNEAIQFPRYAEARE